MLDDYIKSYIYLTMFKANRFPANIINISLNSVILSNFKYFYQLLIPAVADDYYIA